MYKVAMLSVHGGPLGQLGSGEAGGMQAYVRSLSRELGRRGVSVDVFTRRSDPSQPDIVEFSPNARVIHLTAGDAAPVHKSSLFGLLPEFICNLQRFRRNAGLDYNVIHSHYWLSGWVGNLLAPRWDVPHLVMFHTLSRLKGLLNQESGDPENRAEVEARVIAGAHRVVAASEHERQGLVEQYGARRDRVAVVPCGVDLGLFEPGDRESARRRLNLSGDVLLFAGRMDPIKGLDLLLRAVALLKDRPNLSLVLVGGSAAEKEMLRTRALAESLGIGHLVQFRGSVPQEDLADYYRAATVTVVPSRYESFGLVPMESLACGTPVIGSMVGGLPTVVHDGVNGLLVPWRTPRAFADAIGRILDDEATRDALRSRARRSVERFGWGAVAERILSLYGAVSDRRLPAFAGCDGT